MGANRDKSNRARQRVALLIAGMGLLWLAANAAGSYLGWSDRTLALFDLIALAGFGFALWQTINIWRDRQNDKG
ncbi:DUF5337 domain-containing protein [Albibacillus kandeliae]|uniref:DUF5337 domain-containing protein n=1 Tax=Albibacillus kandeliae TaxID=2174228 RepID=UPI000D690A9C|nr:DUF5337 domain-containing protein [Albibacillus kandeliae]